MSISRTREAIILFIGDFFVFDLALSLMLLIRYQGNISDALLSSHISSFSIIFILSILVYFISGLYEKHTMILKKRLPSVLLKTQLSVSLIAALFFYLIPYFGITPKTNLFLFLFFSFILMLIWRLKIADWLTFGSKQKALLIGGGEEAKELMEEVNSNNRYGFRFVSKINADNAQSVDFNQEILSQIYTKEISVIVVDVQHDNLTPVLPELYNLIFRRVHFIDMQKVYEDIFDRVPLPLLSYSWFLKNVSLRPKVMYSIFKQGMDIVITIPLALISLVITPFIWIAIKLDDGGSLMYTQERVGQHDKVFQLYKFRSMSENENEHGEQYVTRVGVFLRKTRLDELPQLWNVLKGDISLIGPRPEMPHLVKIYEDEIPYYKARHIIKPGLSGWAQLYHKAPPKFDAEVDKTKGKLSYDLFYVRNRSLLLDIKIALKTLKVLIMTSGV